MLAGIKRGKRAKKKNKRKDAPQVSSVATSATSTVATAGLANDDDIGGRQGESSNSRNESVADQIRRSLAAGSDPASSHNNVAVSTSVLPPLSSEVASRHRAPPPSASLSLKNDLERRGRIQNTSDDFRRGNNNNSRQEKLVLLPTASSVVRSSGAGKQTLPTMSQQDSSSSSAAAEMMTIQEMVAQERAQTMASSELAARNIARQGGRTKRRRADDSDEEEAMQLKYLKEEDSNKAMKRDLARRLALHDRQEKMTSKCWWWLESSNFQRDRLLALGNYVSLVMAPSNCSITPGNHFYIVPIQHADSLAACDDDVWDEVVRFQSSLTRMYQKQHQNLVFCETVLPHAFSGVSQTKLEAIPLPNDAWQDAALYFRSALVEQAEEWGTHQKLIDTLGKGLRRSVPKNFPYFYVEYDHANNKAGYAQMIESSAFPKNFASDTVTGILQIDPIRFRRRERFSLEEERRRNEHFLQRWKPFDWTLQLDSCNK